MFTTTNPSTLGHSGQNSMKTPLELLPFRGDISVAYVALKHQIREIACHDAPNSVLLDNWGQNNFTLEVDFEFREFVRLRSS